MFTAEKEFKKNAELKESDLRLIKEWISKQPHLPQNITDERIILIMHSCYYSIELTKTTIDSYFTFRTHLPEYFNDRFLTRDDVQEALETSNIVPLPGKTREGYKVIFIELKRTDPQFYNLNDAFKIFNMTLDAILQSEGTYPGLLIIVNFRDMKLGHLAKMTIPTLKKIFTYLQEGFPVRLKGLHYINVVSFIDKFMMMIKPFIKKELMDMLVLHTEGSDTVYEIIPKENLPNEHGGAAGPMSELRESCHKLLTEMEPWYREDEMMRVDETKRAGKAKSAGEIFGVDGSFRKLQVD